MVATLERVVADHGEIVSKSRMPIPSSQRSHYNGTHLDHFQRIVVSPASVTVFQLGAWCSHVEMQRHRIARRLSPPAGAPRRKKRPERQPEKDQPTQDQQEERA